VFRTPSGGDAHDPPADRVVAEGVGRVGDGSRPHVGRADVLHLLEAWTVLITMCSPSVSTHVWVIWGEPSGSRW